MQVPPRSGRVNHVLGQGYVQGAQESSSVSRLPIIEPPAAAQSRCFGISSSQGSGELGQSMLILCHGHMI